MVHMSTTPAVRLKQAKERWHEAIGEVARSSGATGLMAEALSSVVQDMFRLEDDGWTLLSKIDADGETAKGISLSDAQETTRFLERQTKTLGGLMGKGLRLKNNHCFGRGFSFEHSDGIPIKPRHKKIIEGMANWDALFSPTAMKELNRILYTSGNLLVMYDRKEEEFTRLSIDVNIAGAISHPEDRSRIRYILRKIQGLDHLADLSGAGVESAKYEWVPTLAHYEHLRSKKAELPKVLPLNKSTDAVMVDVSQTAVIIEKRVNKDNGDTWGIPDSFSAAPWAIVYTTYLKDGAKLQNALAAISFLVRAKTEVAARAAGAKLSQGKVGQAAITGPDTEIQSMPRAGALDLYEGRPIQAQVASNLDVSVTGLSSDTGLGGSYASESALSQPEQLAALSRQEDFNDFFRQVFRAMGAPELQINFNRLDADPIHRMIQGLTLLREKGGIDQQQYAEVGQELYDIKPSGRSLPKPDEWTGATPPAQPGLEDDPDADNRGSSSPGQGKSGDVGSLDPSGNDAKNSDRDAGTA